MQSVFIKSGNKVFNREQICSFYYEEFETTHNVLHIFTTDGGGVQFYGKAADILWQALSDSSIDMTPSENS